MKNKCIFICALTLMNLISIFNLRASPTNLNERATACGHAMASMMIAANNLSHEDFCTMRNTLYNNSLSASEKYDILDNTSGLLAFRNAFDNAGAVFQENYVEGLFNEESSTWTLARNACLTDLGYNLNGWDSRANVDPCSAYKIQTDANLKTFGLCIAGVSTGCLFSTLAYGICWFSGAALCALQSDVQQKALNDTNPGCVGTQSTTIPFPWKDWMTPVQLDPTHNCTAE